MARPASRARSEPDRGPGDRRELPLRRRRLRRAALRRRRQDLHARRVHAGRDELPPAARRGLVRHRADRLHRARRRHHDPHRQQRRRASRPRRRSRAPGRPAAPPSRPTSSSPAPTRASPRPPAARSTARRTPPTPGRSPSTTAAPCRSFALAGTTVIAAGDQGLLRSSNDGGVTWSGVDKAAIGRGQPLRRQLRERAALRHDDGGRQRPARERPDPLRGSGGTSSGTPSTSQVTPSGTPIAAAAFAAAIERRRRRQRRRDRDVAPTRGKTFTPVGSKLPGSFNGIVAGPAKTAFAYGDNGRDRQDGQRRRELEPASVPTSEMLSGVSFPTPGAGFALDVSGGLFATADARRDVAHARHRHHGDAAAPSLRPDGDDRLRRRPAQRPALGRRRHVLHRRSGQDRQEVR